jgi:death-on-curing protein
VRYLTLNEILRLHEMIIAESSGALNVLSLSALQSAVAQPQMTFGGQDLYPTVADKAAAIAFSIVNNHPFMDGNTRTAHAAAEVFLLLNGFDIEALVDEQERVMLKLASGELDRDTFTKWLRAHVVPRK